MEKMPAIVCAAGYGRIGSEHSKLVDLVGGKPAVARVIENLKAARAFDPIVVVVNKLLGQELILELLNRGHYDIKFAFQTQRRGAAQATLEGVRALGNMMFSGPFLTMFGEMPLLRPETLRELACAHMRVRPTITFLSCPFPDGHELNSVLSKYTFLRQGWDEGHGPTQFLRMYNPDTPEPGDDILGSVYCFEQEWFRENFWNIKPVDKHDGFGGEFHLPPLVEIAVRQGQPVQNIRKVVHEQILGYNTLEDHRVIERVSRQTK